MRIYVIYDDFDPITIDNFTFIKNARLISTKYNKLFIIVKQGSRQADIVDILSEFRCVDNAIFECDDLETTLKHLKIVYDKEIFYISKEGEFPKNCDAAYDIKGKLIYKK
jgi:hypothetical protein